MKSAGCKVPEGTLQPAVGRLGIKRHASQ